MKAFMGCIFLCLLSQGQHCQSHQVQPVPIKSQPIATSQPAPPPAPELPKEPPDHLFRIRVGSSCGYIDRTGKVIIPPQFGSNSRSFSEGLCAVEVHDPDPMKPSKIGFIDLQGKMVIPPQFTKADFFSGGTAIVEVDGNYGEIDRNGKYVTPLQLAPLYTCFPDGLELINDDTGSYFVDRKANIVIKPRSGVSYYHFSEGFAQAESGNIGRTQTYRFINQKGQFVFPYLGLLPHCSDFSEGLAAVSLPESKRYGYIDRTGKFAIPQILEFEPAEGPDDIIGDTIPAYSDFSEGLAVALKKGKYGYINKTGKFVIQPQFDNASSFSDDLAFVSKSGESYFIDKKGNRAITPEKDSHSNQNFSPFINGLACDNIGYIDKTGKYVWKCPDGKRCWD
ncbi:MAG: WG repeat-containing protein [Acidobacteria bacterium]|nr:WG repeat-containing protein [Acidobacteriota bacterium]